MKLKNWRNCDKCRLSKSRRQVVRGRGDIPAYILFIGQAPGKTEDLRGYCFIGRAGKVLDMLIEDATERAGLKEPPRHYIDNTVPCLPPFVPGTHKEREPLEDEVLACVPRILKIHLHVNPRLIIFLGRFPQKYYKKIFRDGIYFPHPSFFARGGGRKHPDYLSAVTKLANIFREVFDAKEKEATA